MLCGGEGNKPFILTYYITGISRAAPRLYAYFHILVKVELCSLDIGTNCVLLYKRWSPYLKIRFHFVEQCV